MTRALVARRGPRDEPARRPTAAPRRISTPTRPRPRISSARRSRSCAATSSCSSSAASAIPSWATPCAGLSAGTERAQRFVDDLLDLAAAGRTEPAAELVALDEALDAARRRLAGELRTPRAEVRAGALPVVRADRELVARLLVHLLRVALAAGARNVEVEAAEEDGIVRVELRDDGTPASGDPFAPFARARGRGPLVGRRGRAHREPAPRRAPRRHDRARPRTTDGTTLVTFTLPAEG